MGHELLLQGANQSLNLADGSMVLGRNGFNLNAMAFGPFFKLSSSMSTFFIQLDALGVAKVLDPSLMKRLKHLGCGWIPAGRDGVLEEEVRCPVGGSLVHNHLEVEGLVAHGELHVVQLDHFPELSGLLQGHCTSGRWNGRLFTIHAAQIGRYRLDHGGSATVA